MEQLIISSPAFRDNGDIPLKYSCEGENINPPIEIQSLPEGTTCLALIVEDPDAPGGTFDHWIVWNIDPVLQIKGNSNPGLSGKNSAGKTGYHGPCPPDRKHKYLFTLFALRKKMNLGTDAMKPDLLDAMEGKILAKGTLTGYYHKVENK